MATSTINPAYLFLYDLVPGPITYELPPADSSGDVFGNASHCNVASAKYQAGKKVAYFDVTNQGWSILSYLRFQDSGDTTPAIADVCCTATATTVVWYDVTQDGDSAAVNYGPFAAIACVAMTDNYWGWFWTGGVCPSDKAPDLAAATTSIYTSTNTVDVLHDLVLIDVGSPARLGFFTYANTDAKPVVGIALHADA